MKNLLKKGLFSWVVLFIACNMLFGQESFMNAYQPDVKDLIIVQATSSALELKDGGIIHVVTQSDVHWEGLLQPTKVKIYKYSKDGTLVWSKEFVYRNISNVNPVFQGSTGSIYLVGQDLVKFCTVVIRMTPNGQILWAKNYWLEAGSDVAISGTGTADGNVILSGYVVNGSHRKGAIWSINPAGDLLWAYLTNNAVTEKNETMTLRFIKENESGNYIISGDGYSEKQSKHFVCLLEIDKHGKKLWSHNYYYESPLFIFDMNPAEGGYIFSAKSGKYGEHFIIRTDAVGGILKQYKYDYPDGYFALLNIYPDEDTSGGYLVLAKNLNFLYSLKLDSLGVVQKAARMDFKLCTIFTGKMERTQDGGYLTAGNFTYKTAQTFDFAMLLKLNKNFEIPCTTEEVNLSGLVMKDIDFETDSTEFFFEAATTTGLDTSLIISNQKSWIFTECETTTTVNVEQKSSTINVFPNPVSSELNISIDSKSYSPDKKYRVVITDMPGRQLCSIEPDYEGRASFDTQALPPGMYSAVLTSEGHQLGVVKFVVVR